MTQRLKQTNVLEGSFTDKFVCGGWETERESCGCWIWLCSAHLKSSIRGSGETNGVTLECDILNQSRHSDWSEMLLFCQSNRWWWTLCYYCGGVYWVTWQPAAVMTVMTRRLKTRGRGPRVIFTLWWHIPVTIIITSFVASPAIWGCQAEAQFAHYYFIRKLISTVTRLESLKCLQWDVSARFYSSEGRFAPSSIIRPYKSLP